MEPLPVGTDKGQGIDPGSIIGVDNDRYAFWVHHKSDPNIYNLYDTWVGGKADGPITGDALWRSKDPTTTSWSVSKDWIVAKRSGGLRVSPWEPGKWLWIYEQGKSQGLAVADALAVGPVVFLPLLAPMDVHVWTLNEGMKPLLVFPQDGKEREADMFNASEQDMVWTQREGLYSEYKYTGENFYQYPVIITHEVNDIYTAPFTTKADVLAKTKRRLRKSLPHYSDFGRWIVGAGYAANAKIPYATIVRLSDGAAWHYKNEPTYQFVEIAGITSEHLYVQMFVQGPQPGAGAWLGRIRLSSLGPPLPADLGPGQGRQAGRGLGHCCSPARR